MKKTKKQHRKINFELSLDQTNAVNEIISGNSLFYFLTGKAGSGKSTVVEYIRQHHERVKVTATTGTAAQLINGITLHSFAAIIPNEGAINSPKANNRMTKTDILIIDEASMMDEWLLLQLIERCKQADHYPKIVLVGDFLQLPPVNSLPLYKSELWKSFKVIKLTTNHRQKDVEFINILNDIRCGQLTNEVNEFLTKKTVEELPDDCIHIMAYKKDVEIRNNFKLEELQEKEHIFEWELSIKYDSNGLQRKLDAVRFPQVLKLKKNARVILLNNDPNWKWVNGSTGIVVHITDKYIEVILDRNKSLVRVERVEETIEDPDGLVLASITQFPMMLGWASTIHKAQGSTIDKIGINLNGHFETGQTYVSLSRCTNPDGIYVCGKLKNIKFSQEAVDLFA